MRKLRVEYEYDTDIFTADNERVAMAKKALGCLCSADRDIWILYSELHSVRKMGKMLGVSKSTMAAQLRRIKAEIYEHLHGIDDTDRNSGLHS